MFYILHMFSPRVVHSPQVIIYHEFFNIKQNMNFDFQPPSMFAFLVSHKNNLVIPLKICLNTKFHGPTLTDESFSFTLQVITPAI
jgi:hypothetical protein